jgi:hypothetical protein
MSATDTHGTAAGMSTPAHGAAGVSAPAATATMSAPAASAAMTASTTPAAMTAASRNSYAMAKRRVFLVENMKSRQTDVRDFLLGQNQSPRVIQRWSVHCVGGRGR